MTTALAIRDEVEIRPSLTQLAEAANREHALVEQALGSALDHAIKCGEALTEARMAIEFKGWRAWVEEHFGPGHVVASYYMRLAHYQDLIRDLPNVAQAMRSLRGMPAIRSGGYDGYSEEVREEARQLAASGLKNSEIAQTLGVTPTTVACWVDPEALRRHRERVRQQAAERRAARKEQERLKLQRKAERAARKAGGSLAESYSLAHRLEDQLAQAERQATGEAKKALAAAVEAHHRMKDEIVRALGVSSA